MQIWKSHYIFKFKALLKALPFIAQTSLQETPAVSAKNTFMWFSGGQRGTCGLQKSLMKTKKINDFKVFKIPSYYHRVAFCFLYLKLKVIRAEATVCRCFSKYVFLLRWCCARDIFGHKFDHRRIWTANLLHTK